MGKGGVVFVIFGATGDLSKRKLIPGIYDLVKRKELGKFHILGLGRRDYEKKLIDSSKKYIGKTNSKIISQLKKNSSYLQLDFTKKEDYLKLDKKLKELGKKGIKNRIFYLATGSDNFDIISKNIQKIGANREGDGFARVVFEKPFGLNLKSSKKLNKSVKRIFTEKQIYRIDHYLGKELVSNISILRFANQIIEPLWNNKHIESVQVILNEKIGIEERGPYYDKYGVIRDMVQNHVMQLISLVGMEKPKSFSKDYLRDKKSQLLKCVKIKEVLISQYSGYTLEKGIPKTSQTPTFTAMKIEINNSRWRGVPFFIKTGKKLNDKTSRINIIFKKPKCLLDSCSEIPNLLEIKIKPDEGISLTIDQKVPGKNKSIPVKMNFCHSCTFGPNTPEGYENLFLDIIKGDQSVFVRQDELENSWKIIDKIKKGKLSHYDVGSCGPRELMRFNKKNKIRWIE